VDLTDKRLLGFKAVLSDYINAPPYRQDLVNIKTLDPIIAPFPECSYTSFLFEEVQDLSVAVSTGFE
jgi:hypothetical protein